ncbi:MAG: hypothetical protein ABR529_06550 [Actinomycetota bacterium]
MELLVRVAESAGLFYESPETDALVSSLYCEKYGEKDEGRAATPADATTTVDTPFRQEGGVCEKA